MEEEKEITFTKKLINFGTGSMGFVVPIEITTAYSFKEGDFFEVKIKRIKK